MVTDAMRWSWSFHHCRHQFRQQPHPHHHSQPHYLGSPHPQGFRYPQCFLHPQGFPHLQHFPHHPQCRHRRHHQPPPRPPPHQSRPPVSPSLGLLQLGGQALDLGLVEAL